MMALSLSLQFMMRSGPDQLILFMRKILTVTAILCLLLSHPGFAESSKPNVINGTITKIQKAQGLITVKTLEEKSLTLTVPRDCPVINELVRREIGDFSVGDAIVASAGDKDEKNTARCIFSLDSLLMLISGSISISGYNGVISSIDLKTGTVVVKSDSGESREVLIADYTKLEKNFRKAKLSDFKPGDRVFTEDRFGGLPRHSFNLPVLELFDGFSFVCNKIAATQGTESLQGTVKSVDEASRTLMLNQQQVGFTKDTILISGTRDVKSLKGKKVIVFAGFKHSNRMTASSIFDIVEFGEVMYSVDILKGLWKRGATLPIAVGKVLEVQQEKGQIALRNKWAQEVLVRISPANTLFLSRQKSGMTRVSFGQLKKGDNIFVEGLPPDQGIRVTIL